MKLKFVNTKQTVYDFLNKNKLDKEISSFFLINIF